MRRREASKLIAAAPIVVPAVLRATSRSEQIAFGLIGTGNWGRRLLSHANAVSSGRCVALCDPDAANLAQAARSSRDRPQSYIDYRPVLDRKDVQGVIVASPPYTHFPVVRDALLAGKHVFCEPPLAFQPGEIHALRKLSLQSDRVIQVGFQRRYSKFYRTAKQMVSKGFIGEITNINAQWHQAETAGPNPDQTKQSNWRYYRQFSGGLTSERASHAMDVANWMFVDNPASITGAGGIDWKRDGRDTYDNIALILRYPEGPQMLFSAISTNSHLPYFGGTRKQCGEMLIGTEGTIEISLGVDDERPLGLWFYEPTTSKVSTAEDAKAIERIAGATVARKPGGGSWGMPILLESDQITGNESFLQRELKYARRWMYSKGLAVPEEDRPPVKAELEEFFQCCLAGSRPRADVEVGLDNSAAVVLANLAMDEERRVQFGEIEQLGTCGDRKRR